MVLGHTIRVQREGWRRFIDGADVKADFMNCACSGYMSQSTSKHVFDERDVLGKIVQMRRAGMHEAILPSEVDEHIRAPALFKDIVIWYQYIAVERYRAFDWRINTPTGNYHMVSARYQ